MTTSSTGSQSHGAAAGAGGTSSPHPAGSAPAGSPAAAGLPPQRPSSHGRPSAPEPTGATRPARDISTGFLIGRALVLGIMAGILIYAVPPLVAAQSWIALSVLGVVSVLIGYLYLSRRHIAAKYLVPGTIFLIAFQVFPVVFTMSTAFTNFGDGHRGSKAEAVTSIERTSVVQVPGSPEYLLTVARADGELVFLLVDPETKDARVGTVDGLSELAGAEVGVTGKVLSAPGYDILTTAAAGEIDQQIAAFAVPTPGGAIKASGISRAWEGKANKKYDAGCDCVTDVDTGEVWVADESKGYFVNAAGENISQGWQINVGLKNFTRVFTDSTISGNFLGVFGWNVAFALGSVLTTFALGMIVALALHSPRVRGTKIYRTILILPYAMPSFAMLLIWRDMFNKDFGLINGLLDTDIDWLGQANTARLALIMVNLWLGFPYMFLVTTGALQAIPRELIEASSIDGASPLQGFRKVTLPLLLVALTPLLIASFAFNFNNFNAIQLVSAGGPYAVDNASVGATDLLITYTYRLAFGGSAQFGFAAAISIFIFAIVAIISTVAFRRTRAQEEVYS